MNINDFFDYAPANHEIYNAFAKTQQHLATHEKPLCKISGGADSDIMLDIVSKADTQGKVSYVFFNTGIEYDATKKHLDYLRQKYGVEIKEYEPKLYGAVNKIFGASYDYMRRYREYKGGVNND